MDSRGGSEKWSSAAPDAKKTSGQKKEEEKKRNEMIKFRQELYVPSVSFGLIDN